MEKTQRGPAEVRNPLLGLPAMQKLRRMLADQPEVQRCLADVLKELGAQADTQAEASWFRRKAPMAAYWRAVAVYARHVARAIVAKGQRP